ncbi:nitrate/nitrite transporter NrtS [Gammaproteobacteria bacterium AH-315-C21]|nr:nitrate/nitrite transporter NrtS [Gammaproteobacteria bacterium AH-315-C21]
MSADPFLILATSPKVVSRAIKVALVVGTMLASINHGRTIWYGELSRHT